MTLELNIVCTVNSISAETVNHCIKDKTFQEIINNVPHKNNTLVSQFLILTYTFVIVEIKIIIGSH